MRKKAGKSRGRNTHYNKAATESTPEHPVRGTLVWPHGERFEGKFVNGVREGRGVLYTRDGGALTAVWRNGVPLGPAILVSKDGSTIAGAMGEDGFEGECVEKYPDDEVKFEGTYKCGERHFGEEIQPDGSKLKGEWVQNVFQGASNVYVYPDGITRLEGCWLDGQMIAAKCISVTADGKEMTDEFEYRYDPSTETRLSRYPLVQDPMETRCVVVAPSNVANGGDGLFARIDLPAGRVVAYYSGVRLRVEEANERSWEENEYTIRLTNPGENSDDEDDGTEGVALSVPVEDATTNQYCATLGHKINHASGNTVNTEFDFCMHPRFGEIRSIVTTKNVRKDEELFADYGYGDFKELKPPSWFTDQNPNHK